MTTITVPAAVPQPIVVHGHAVSEWQPRNPARDERESWLVTVQLTLGGSPATARVWMETNGDDATITSPRFEIADDIVFDLFPFRSWTEAEMARMVDACIAEAWGTV